MIQQNATLMYSSWCGTGVNNRMKHPSRPQNDLISTPSPLSFCFSKRSLPNSPSPPLQGRIQEMEELPWSVFCPAWPSPLRTSLNHSFAAPQESKSMGGRCRSGWHSTMRTGRGDVWRREKWHYGAGVARLVTAQREKKKYHKKMESNQGERRLRASAAHLRPIRRRSAEMPGLPALCFCFHYQKAFL